MEQKAWKEVVISIDVRADHNSHSFENRYPRESLEQGDIISDKGLDGREAFSPVIVKTVDAQSLTITYGIYDHTLNRDKQWIKLDTSGRDYTTFELYVSIEF